MEYQNYYHVETDEFDIYYDRRESDGYHSFKVVTKKSYSRGKRYQIIHLSDEFVSNELESVIIETLSDQMRGVLTYLTAQGEL
jgi:phosphopantetheine adenylyltransferase